MWQYAKLIVRPTLIGSLAAFCWYVWYVSPYYIGFPLEDKEVFQSILGLIGVVHGFIASMQIQKVSDQHQKIQRALALKDRKLFEENACIRINPAIKFLLAVFSIIFFIIFLFFPFASIFSGMVTLGTTMFILYLLWEVASELDDPFHGIWSITQKQVNEIFDIKADDSCPPHTEPKG